VQPSKAALPGQVNLMSVVLLTDYAWPDVSIERALVEAAGHTLVCGASTPASAAEIASLAAAHGPAGILTCWAQVSRAAIEAAPELAIIARMGVGLDNIDVAAASAHGAVVTNVPDYCVEEVSDHAVALLLAWARGVCAFDRSVKGGAWAPAQAQLRRVRDMTVGIYGYGRIGKRTAEKLAPFGVRLLAYSPSYRGECIAEAASFDAMLAASDVIIIHAPLTDATKHIFSKETLARMKGGAFLINASRGPLVENEAIERALDSGRLSGAGLDVIEGEPEPPRSLVERANVIVTPHVAFSSDASLCELRRRAAEEVVRVLAGKAPLHPCNSPEKRP